MAYFGKLARYFMNDPTGVTKWDVANGEDDPIAYMLRIMMKSRKGEHYVPMFGVSDHRYNLGKWVRKDNNKSGGEYETLLAHPFAGTFEPIATYNNAPFVGFSGIGVHHPLFSIYDDWDFERMPAPIRKALVKDFMKSPYYNRAVYFFGSDPIKEEDIAGVKENIYPFLVNAIVDNKKGTIAPKKVRDFLLHQFVLAADAAGRDLFRSGKVSTKELRERFIDSLEDIGISGYIPSEKFLDDLIHKYENTDWKKYVSNYMHDSLLHNLGGVLQKGTNMFNNEAKQRMRIVQAATRLRDVIPNADVIEGKSAGLREGSGEYVTLEFLPKEDFGGMLDFFDREGKPVEYDNLREKGVDADEAWEETIGDRLGDREFLISDKDVKNVGKMFREDIDNYIRRHAIANGCRDSIGE